MVRELNQIFVSLLFNARNKVRFAMDDQFKPLDITDATWRTLYFLRQEGDGVQQKELARTMGIEGPSLVRLLDNLSEKKLIERRADPSDRRSKTIHLTAQAQPLLEELDQYAREVRSELFAEISDADLQTCVRVFERILSRYNTWNKNCSAKPMCFRSLF